MSIAADLEGSVAHLACPEANGGLGRGKRWQAKVGVNQAVLQPVLIVEEVGARRVVLDRVMGPAGWDSSAGDGPDAAIGGGGHSSEARTIALSGERFFASATSEPPGCRGGEALPSSADFTKRRIAGRLFQFV